MDIEIASKDTLIFKAVAKLHAKNIDQGFLSSLGPKFLTLLYEAIVADKDSVLIISKFHGEVSGFVCGTRNMLGIYKQLFVRLPRLIFVLLPVLVSPRKMVRIFEIFRKLKGNSELPDIPKEELLFIAVDISVRGKGQANRLFDELVSYFKVLGCLKFHIVVGATLLAANKFYSKLGAYKIGQVETHKDQQSFIYIKDC